MMTLRYSEPVMMGDSSVYDPGQNLAPALVTAALGSVIAIFGPLLVKSEYQKNAFLYIGGFAGAIGLVNLVSAVMK